MAEGEMKGDQGENGGTTITTVKWGLLIEDAPAAYDGVATHWPSMDY